MTLMKKEIEKWEGKDGWIRFMEFMEEVCAPLSSNGCTNVHLGPRLIATFVVPSQSHIHYEVSLKEVLHQNFPNIRSVLKLPYVL